MPTHTPQLQFPKDESVHNHIIEWWYWNGHLKDKRGHEYSFMNCLFRADIKRVKIPFLDKLPVDALYFSHSILSDLKHKIFHHRITPFSIVSPDSFSKPLLYINYTNLENGDNSENFRIEKADKTTYHIKNEDIDLKLTSTKKPLLVSGNGFFNVHPETMYGYSLTNLSTKGKIKTGSAWINVVGKSWMDHWWANASYSPKKRWDWFSVQLNNDTELVFFKHDNGTTKVHFADISYPNGKHEHYEKIQITPLGRSWTSQKSNAVYPTEWKIGIPAKKIALVVEARIENQEMLFGSINYWEGPISVKGFLGNEKVNGVGFMELVGYPSRYDANYLGDEIRKTAQWLISVAQNSAFIFLGNVKRKIIG